MRTYTKADVELHGDIPLTAVPAVNVKAYRFPSVYAIAERFNCSEQAAERALELAFECHQVGFWEDIESRAREILKRPVKVYSGGRSGGWVEVHGLPDLDSWDAIDLARWRSFARSCERARDYLTSLDALVDTIEANGYASEDN